MKNHITNLEIKNFKSIKHIKMDCKRMNVLIGKPNVGKSNILEALSLFCAPYSMNNDRFLSEFIRYEEPLNLIYDQDKTKMVSVETNVGVAYLRYHYGQVNQFDLILSDKPDVLNHVGLNKTINELYENFKKYVSSQKKSEIPFLNKYYNFSPDGRILPNISKEFTLIRKYTFDLAQFLFGRNQNRYDFFLMPPYGINLFTILDSHAKLFSEVNQFFNEYGLDLVIDSKNNLLLIQKKVRNRVYQIPYSLIADTLLRIIFHLAAIETNENTVLLFEEPEAHSFPKYVSMIADKMVESKTNQFFVATHSNYWLGTVLEKMPKKDLAVFICTYQNYETKVKRLTDKEIDNILVNGVDLFFNLKAFSK